MEKLLCGVDLGGTKLSVGLFTQEGRQIDKREIKSHTEKDNDGVATDIIDLLELILSENRKTVDDILGIGIGVAAHIRFRDGVIITSSNFKNQFKNYPLREKIRSRFSIPVVLDNDANAQAYGEYKFGAGQGRRDIVFMTVSSGIGAGIIIDGRLLRGVTGTAGEIGHTITKFDSDQKCTCGNYGCLMAQSSGIFFPALYAAKLGQGKKSRLNIAADSVSQVDGLLIARGVQQGDEICTEIFHESARMIGIGVYNLFELLNPEAVILGGGLMNLGPDYLKEIRGTFYSLVKDMMYDRMEIVPAALAGESGLVGAAALLLEQQ